MLSLRRKVDPKNVRARKKLITSHSTSEDNMSLSSAPVNSTGANSSDPRRIVSINAQDNKLFSETDNSFSDFDSTYSIFNSIFDKLKSSDPQDRSNATKELKESLISISRDLSAEQFQRFTNVINNKIFELLHGATTDEKIGGITAVDTLIAFYLHIEELPNQTARLANYLRMVLPSNDMGVMRLAASTLGKLAVPGGGTITSEFVEGEVKNSLEWLTSVPENNTSSKLEYKKHASLLILTGLADNSPYLLYPFIDDILENILNALRDNKSIIREDTAKLLGKCLIVLRTRNNSHENERWIEKLFKECDSGFTFGGIEYVHSSLLIYYELLSSDNNRLIKNKINEMFKNCMHWREHKSEVVRLEVYRVFPLFSKFNRKIFITKYMDPIVKYCLKALKTMRVNFINIGDRGSVLMALGDIAFETGHNITPYLDEIIYNITDGLKMKYKIRRPFEEELFYCVQKLSIAIGPALLKYLNKDILDLMLQCYPTQYMQDTLGTIISKTPSAQKGIDERLCTSLSRTLYGGRFYASGPHTSTKPVNIKEARKYRNRLYFNANRESNTDENDCKVLIQSLKMLKDISGTTSITKLTSLVIIDYTAHEDPEVRKLAAFISCKVFSKTDNYNRDSTEKSELTAEILSKLLSLAITDPVDEIRLEILQNLNKNFIHHLAQPDNLRFIFITLHDQYFPIQKEAIKLIGALSESNASSVIPFLQKTMLGYLSMLRHTHITRRKEETAILLDLLIVSSPTTCQPYLAEVLEVLLIKVQDPSTSVVCTSLDAIGDLTIAVGIKMRCHIDRLMPIIMSVLHDQSNSMKREAALRTLGKISSASGYVIEPYLDYHNLLGELMGILKTESSMGVKTEALRVIGILGALDPYKHRASEFTTNSKAQVEQNAPPIEIALLMRGMSPSNEEYYPRVAITRLTRILNDSTLSTHYTTSTQAIIHILQLLGTRSTVFLDQVMPSILSVMKTCPPSLLDFYFQQLGSLITLAKQEIVPYVEEVFTTIFEFFPIIKLQSTIISLIEITSATIGSELKQYMPLILTHFLNVLEHDSSVKKVVSTKILKCLVAFETNLEEYVHFIIPKLIYLAEYSIESLRKSAIFTIGKLARIIDLSEVSSTILHTLVRILNSDEKDLIKATMNTICFLLLQMDHDFIVFIPIINKTLIRKKIQHSIYDQLISRLLNNESLPINSTDKIHSTQSKVEEPDTPPLRNLAVNEENLKISWDCSQQRTRDDWQEWFRRLSIQLLKESPSQALRACSNLVSAYYPLARDLFNVSFASCWRELGPSYKDDFMKSLNKALSSLQTPPEIYQTLLNVVEFMEHDSNMLPLTSQTLGKYAQKCHAFAKALYYEEQELTENANSSTIESLISINNQLHQTDASIGILKYAEQHHDMQLKETWYEKLQRWEDALNSYNERINEGDTSSPVMLGKMRSLYALGEWTKLFDLTKEKWNSVTHETRQNIAPLTAGAVWNLGYWDMMEQYVNHITPNTFEREYFDAIFSLHRNNFHKSTNHIDNARNLLMTDMSSSLNESYSRTYGFVIRLQILSELEEIITYKKLPFNSLKKEEMKDTWNKRLLGVQKNVDVWQQALLIRSLVVKPKDDINSWVKFANLCRKSNRMGMAKTVLNMLVDNLDDPDQPYAVVAPPPVVYAQLKYLWAEGSEREALSHLITFTSKMTMDLGLDPTNMIRERVIEKSNTSPENVHAYTKLLSRCFLKQGEWRAALEPNWRLVDSNSILGSYLLATHFDKSSYKAWHNWALANFEVISVSRSKRKEASNDEKQSVTSKKDVVVDETNQSRMDLIGSTTFTEIDENDYSAELIQHHVVPAMKGFFHSIALSGVNSIQDALRLLTLWFKFGGLPEATQAMHEGFTLINIATWLEVLPQLISRIHQENIIVSRSLLSLLSNLGKVHPQELVYPLTVAIKSESVSRQKAALSIVENMRMHSSELVDQAELVSHELIRIAVLWHELWYEGLENASRQYFGEHNIEKMFATLEPLHELLQAGPETLREISFQNHFGRDLGNAYKWVKKYKLSNDLSNLNQAWDIYYNVFRKISKLVPELEMLELQHVSPKLLKARNMKLTVPGTYRVGEEVITISHFEPVVPVISSKQRPRKISIKGTDGRDYQYALKGHEDIRQDSLVMQLFGLVNSLLQNDPECFRRHLDIQQFPAIPLSPKSGILGWVPNSDTFHVLIRDYRETNKVPLNIEHWVMLQMAPDYDILTLLQKVEVFEYAMDNTEGKDLADVLWLKSRSSESWLERRTTYTRSLAVMSIVGYILGLGDRHPSNLMLDKYTGKVVHIDFGDCFEAAILRDKFPEKVPFRLTRMLTNAMEVSGVEGSFRITCENIMRVLRDNKESLMAILEAFAFDPLIHWGFDISREKIMEMTGIELPDTNLNDLLRKGAITQEEFTKMEEQQDNEMRNARSVLVLRRITAKLVGNDIIAEAQLDVPEQVDMLIQQATSIENLCQHYIGWCPFW
ncbi:similar to Saccharomyces cerevisiae YKL203C TOR2 PIK-related protein kinase and rapamycin target [Maudiozyma saulgeensis]|uniref:Serine/threonine-protein kinase TOR n=1 Tax=Maudiozyma saulgeensis TaxID=1789683 RepID=A0A1X7R179_9SACH|nr:similar to Saccharomyces cerevisiae YKL203C TOR2 PIK-related protein kinase and rapamycin target [Kazachstania saulgeensis]